MNTPRGSLGYEGTVDVSAIVPACFNNPLKNHAINFLAEVLNQKRRALIPVSAVIGAYHIATRYLKASKLAVKKVLEGLLRTKSPALYPYVSPELAMDSLDYASAYHVEAWDGYLIALSRSLGVKVVYSMDEELAKVKEMIVVNPFPEDKLAEYREWINARIRRS